MRKHFNLSSDREVKLLTLYLVTSLWGLRINHPILVLTGEKGSSKSSSFKKLEELIDPKSSELGSGIPRGSDGLEVRLYNGYFVTFDNLSSLSRKFLQSQLPEGVFQSAHYTAMQMKSFWT